MPPHTSLSWLSCLGGSRMREERRSASPCTDTDRRLAVSSRDLERRSQIAKTQFKLEDWFADMSFERIDSWFDQSHAQQKRVLDDGSVLEVRKGDGDESYLGTVTYDPRGIGRIYREDGFRITATFAARPGYDEGVYVSGESYGSFHHRKVERSDPEERTRPNEIEVRHRERLLAGITGVPQDVDLADLSDLKKKADKLGLQVPSRRPPSSSPSDARA